MEAAANRAPRIVVEPGRAREGEAFSFRPSITDPDGDTLAVTVEGLPAWLNFDAATYTFSGLPGAEELGPSPVFRIVASDGRATTSVELVIDVLFDPLEQALRSGDHRYLDSAQPLINSLDRASAVALEEAAALRRSLFQLSADDGARPDGSSLLAVSWEPSHDAAVLSPRFGENAALLVSNSVCEASYEVQAQALAVLGARAGRGGSARFAAFGGNPMRNHYRDNTAVNADMEALLSNLLHWLWSKDGEVDSVSVVIAHMDQSYYFPDQGATRHWLQQRYAGRVEFNDAGVCDGEELAGCLAARPDLLIVSQLAANAAEQEAAQQAIAQWLARGGSLLYLHHDGDLKPLGENILGQLDVRYRGDNYWRRLGVNDFDVRGLQSRYDPEIQQINTLVKGLESGDLAVNLAPCSNNSCPSESGYAEHFEGAASLASEMFKSLDKRTEALFEQDGLRYHKSLLLLADFYRARARFPMDKETTPTAAFLRALFADYVQYQRRDINPAAPDMGNFSRSDFSHITPQTRRVEMLSGIPFRGAGVYALPGQTVTVRRLDNSPLAVEVFVNTLRSGATHLFDKEGYSRPKFVKGQALRIESGQSLRFTSAYGGPVQLGFDRNKERVELEFQGVGQHPFWASDRDTVAFEQGLEVAAYDWAELSTPRFEVHSKLEKMRQSVARYVDAAELGAATERYISTLPHALAGFAGQGIVELAEVEQFASERGWSLASLDVVKHMNADQASCGSGCSGNPYDAYWSFNPLGHGDLHELGHGLERGRFRFEGWEGHATTNPYSYYSKSQYYRDTGVDPNCQSLPFAELKQVLLESRSQQDPFAYMQGKKLHSWSQGVAITIQMMMSAQAEGVLVNGWHLLARLHILDREYSRADNSDEAWLAERDALGFSHYSRAQARAIGRNDWLAIALSQAMARDMRNYLAMWGLGISDAAASQIASYGYAALPLRFYDSGARDYCINFQPPAIAIH